MFNLAAGIDTKCLDNTFCRGVFKVKWILVFHVFSGQDMNLQCEAVASIHDILQDTTV